MKSKILSLSLAAFAIVGMSFTTANTDSIEIGTKAPKTKMKMEATDGELYSLEDLANANGLLVVFSCNTCPFVVGSSRGTEGWEGRYGKLYMECQKRNVGMVLVNSNEAKRDAGDSMEDMIARQKEQGFEQIPYVLDRRHVVADAFGAKTTPHCFLFNGDMELVYKGAIDDNVDNAEAVEATWLINAIDSSTRGQKIDPNSTKPLGCSIKRVG